MYSESELDELIRQSISDCKNSPRICQFRQTNAGFQRIFNRVKQHIIVRGITDLDTALALVESELSEPNTY